MTHDPKNRSHQKVSNPANSLEELERPLSDALSHEIDENNLPTGDYNYYRDLGPAGKKLMVVRNGKIIAAQG
jgi:hypothetical protein